MTFCSYSCASDTLTGKFDWKFSLHPSKLLRYLLFLLLAIHWKDRTQCKHFVNCSAFNTFSFRRILTIHAWVRVLNKAEWSTLSRRKGTTLCACVMKTIIEAYQTWKCYFYPKQIWTTFGWYFANGMHGIFNKKLLGKLFANAINRIASNFNFGK